MKTKRTPKPKYWISVSTSEEKGQKCLILSNSATSEEYSVSVSKILLCFLLREKLRNAEGCQGFECSPLASEYWEKLSQDGFIKTADLITDPNFEVLYRPEACYTETFRFVVSSVSGKTLCLDLYDLVTAITYLSLYKQIPKPYFQAEYCKAELWEQFSYHVREFADRLCDIFIFDKARNKPGKQDKACRDFVVNDSLKISIENSKPLKLQRTASGVQTTTELELSEILSCFAFLHAIKEGDEIFKNSYLPEIRSSWWNKLSKKGLLVSEGLSIPQIDVLSHENSEAPEEIRIETRKGETVCLSSEELLSILFCLQLCGVIDEPKVKAPRRSSYWREVFRLFPRLRISLLRQQFAYLKIEYTP